MRVRYIQILRPKGYYEWRFSEQMKLIVRWHRTPFEARTDIRKFYDYFLDWFKFDDDPYGISASFEDEKIIFTHDKTGEVWAEASMGVKRGSEDEI